jgi:hypothetical protein
LDTVISDGLALLVNAELPRCTPDSALKVPAATTNANEKIAPDRKTLAATAAHFIPENGTALHERRPGLPAMFVMPWNLIICPVLVMLRKIIGHFGPHFQYDKGHIARSAHFLEAC